MVIDIQEETDLISRILEKYLYLSRFYVDHLLFEESYVLINYCFIANTKTAYIPFTINGYKVLLM